MYFFTDEFSELEKKIMKGICQEFRHKLASSKLKYLILEYMKRESLEYPNQSNQNLFFNYKAWKHKFKEREA